jgi:hypothetical protein
MAVIGEFRGEGPLGAQIDNFRATADPRKMCEQEIHSYWITSSGRKGCVGVAEARFPYWSFTKTAISICALKLVEVEALDLDTRLNRQSYKRLSFLDCSGKARQALLNHFLVCG